MASILPQRSPAPSRWSKWLLLLSLVAIVGAVFLWIQSVRRPASADIPVIGKVADFLLTERSGKPLTRASLEGRFWIADFIFTSCAGTCPVMTARMKKLSDDLAAAPDVVLVSFSVDPARDSPQVLRQYADKIHAPIDRWLFLTGDASEIDRLAVKSFKITNDLPTPDEILHSEQLFLVDRQGRVRGSYRALTEQESNDLMKVSPNLGIPDAEKKRLFSDIAALRRNKK